MPGGRRRAWREGEIDQLNDDLQALLASRRENPGWDAAWREILVRLDRDGFYQGILPEGAAFPDFMLPNTEGRLVSLAERLAQGPVVLGFFRGAWCPFCKRTLEALAEAGAALAATGASLLALTPETGDWPARLSARHHNALEVLADADFGVGLQAGVVFRVPPLYRARLEASGVALPLRHGNAAWCLPVPALFVIRPDGIISWRFASADFAVRPPIAEIFAALGRL